jgi:hypothetical protein
VDPDQHYIMRLQYNLPFLGHERRIAKWESEHSVALVSVTGARSVMENRVLPSREYH